MFDLSSIDDTFIKCKRPLELFSWCALHEKFTIILLLYMMYGPFEDHGVLPLVMPWVLEGPCRALGTRSKGNFAPDPFFMQDLRAKGIRNYQKQALPVMPRE